MAAASSASSLEMTEPPVFLDGVLEQPFPQGRCSFDVDRERWDGIHSALTPAFLGTTKTAGTQPLVGIARHPASSRGETLRVGRIGRAQIRSVDVRLLRPLCFLNGNFAT